MDQFSPLDAFVFFNCAWVINDLFENNQSIKKKKVWEIKIWPRKVKKIKKLDKWVKKFNDRKRNLKKNNKFFYKWFENPTFQKKKGFRKKFLKETNNTSGNSFLGPTKKKTQLIPLNVENKVLTELEGDGLLLDDYSLTQSIKKCLNSVCFFERKKKQIEKKDTLRLVPTERMSSTFSGFEKKKEFRYLLFSINKLFQNLDQLFY
mmetsp:Transcript_26569/g.53324  ORF Transcript_26569/g.53324 Transcript_26569/m.53324 type:complete len:205 (-) Transcript_26569:846-1460(-)